MTALYEEQLFVDHLQTELPDYIIKLSQENNNDEVAGGEEDTVIIFFGHLGEHLHNPEAVWSDSYRELDNECMVISEIQICCPRDSLVTVVNAVKEAYKGWTPFPNDSNYSSMSFLKGQVATYSSGKVWWSEQVGVITPRIS